MTISSILTIPFKVTLLLKAVTFIAFGIYFLYLKQYIVFAILFSISCLLILLTRLIKIVSVKNRSIYYRGILSKVKKIPITDMTKVGYFPFFFFIKLKSEKRIFFLGSAKDELRVIFNAPEPICEEIYKRIQSINEV